MLGPLPHRLGYATWTPMPTFEHEGLTLSYEDLGGPRERTVVFLHGLLLAHEMMEPIARALGPGFRPLLLDLRGHGRSSRPADPRLYSIPEFTGDLMACLDHLGVERGAVFGTSLGAVVGAEAILDYPDRFAGAVLEMPVLERGVRAARRVFRPLARALRTRAAPRVLDVLARRIPAMRVMPGYKESLAAIARAPAAGAAVIEGLLARPPRSRWSEVDACEVPALVIAHRRDPLHAQGDAVELAERLPRGELLMANSLVELRLSPARIMGAVRRFLTEAFAGEAQQKIG
jgi:pimeloyl-ACP methyl ester carboxylesterase